MKIIIFTLFLMGISYPAFADSTDRSLEYILNRVYDSATETLRVQ